MELFIFAMRTAGIHEALQNPSAPLDEVKTGRRGRPW